jgi:hypothetical protein
MSATLQSSDLAESLKTLFREQMTGAAAGQPNWILDQGPGPSLLGTLDSIDAATASRILPGLQNSIAGHAGHVRYALDVFIRALSGEDSFSTADWPSSWAPQSPSQSEWTALSASLRRQLDDLMAVLDRDQDWTNLYVRTGSIAQVAHLAYHLGAIRQLAALARQHR